MHVRYADHGGSGTRCYWPRLSRKWHWEFPWSDLHLIYQTPCQCVFVYLFQLNKPFKIADDQLWDYSIRDSSFIGRVRLERLGKSGRNGNMHAITCHGVLCDTWLQN